MNEKIRALLAERAELRARISQIPFDGSIEVKESASGKYLYARSRVAGKNTSKYIDVYSEEAHALLLRQATDLRALKKSLRHVEKELATLGYEDKDLTSLTLLNIDFARANIKNLIYGQAVLEGVSTTFPQTEDILENGTVSGMKASDVQKILDLKHAWEFILDRDVVGCASDLAVLSRIATLINEGFYEYGGRIRSVPVSIGGCSYKPPLPSEESIQQIILSTQEEERTASDIGIRIASRLMRAQPFIDGNKRTAFIFANHYLISHGAGLLCIPEQAVQEFRKRLVDYYETDNEEGFVEYMKATCFLALEP